MTKSEARSQKLDVRSQRPVGKGRWQSLLRAVIWRPWEEARTQGNPSQGRSLQMSITRNCCPWMRQQGPNVLLVIVLATTAARKA